MPSGLRHTPHPFKLRTIQVIGAFYLYGLGFDALFAFFQIIAVIALVLVYTAVVYLDYLRAGVIPVLKSQIMYQSGFVSEREALSLIRVI
jgi:hypothetical protein